MWNDNYSFRYERIIPVAISSNSIKIIDGDIEQQLPTTQFDNSVVESAGLLKMDFLGLKTLSIISDAIKLIKLRHSVEINIDEIPLTIKSMNYTKMDKQMEHFSLNQLECRDI